MKMSMMVPVVLQVVMMTSPANANELTDGLAESACTLGDLDELHSIPWQQQRHGTLKISGCQIKGPVSESLSHISMSVHGAMTDDLEIINNGQYYKVSGERFIISNIVNDDMELHISLKSSKPFYSDNMALFELSYM